MNTPTPKRGKPAGMKDTIDLPLDVFVKNNIQKVRVNRKWFAKIQEALHLEVEEMPAPARFAAPAAAKVQEVDADRGTPGFNLEAEELD